VLLIRPAFIRGLLENVGAGIDPIRLIRRIKNGLEIPGLKPALIKILQDFNLQLSLLDGCKTILDGDCADLAKRFHKDQTSGFFLSGIPVYHSRTYLHPLTRLFRQDDMSDMHVTTTTTSAGTGFTLPLSARRSRQVCQGR
jgi:hypothetical protein